MYEEIGYLKNSLIYSMYSGSHEYFHSNIWVWLMKQDSRYIKVFFPDFDDECYYQIFREKDKMDIRIETKLGLRKELYVIENRFRYFPKVKQFHNLNKRLERYNMKGRLLVDIKDSFGLAQEVGWQFLSYREIVTRLEEELKKENLLVTRVLLQEYLTTLKCIQHLMDEEFNSNKPYLRISLEDFLQYKKLDLDHIMRKMSANEFIAYLKEHLQVYKEHEDRVEILGGYVNGCIIIEIYYILKGTKENWQEKIGICIQEKQYRYCVAAKTDDVDGLFESYVGTWFDGEDDTYPTTRKEKKAALAPRTHKFFAGILWDKEKYVYQHHNDLVGICYPFFDKICRQIDDDLLGFLQGKKKYGE